MYEFTEDCMIHIDNIDEEHRKLFQMLNEAFALVKETDNAASIAKNLIDNLKDYVVTHFAHEEEYMKNILKTIPEIEAFYTVGIHKRRIDEAEFQDAFRKMIDRNQETTVCFVVGSFYLAGMAKEFINQEEENVRL